MSDRAVSVVALFPDAQTLMDAIPRVKSRELGKIEAYTPYPVHGLDKALGLKPSPLGVMVFSMGFLGALTGLLLQWWTSAVDYPVRIGGKPFFSWQAFVPIMFELMVLFAAFTAGLGMLLLLNRLPWFGHPMLRSKAIAASTRDRFALAIEAQGHLDVAAAETALREAGGSSLEVLKAPPPAAARGLPLREALGILAACVVAGITTYYGIKFFPALPPMNDMEQQHKAVAFRASAFFADGSSMRLPVEGTVARGHMPLGVADAEQAGTLLVNPLPRSPEVFARGRKSWESYCQVCHGALGDGKDSLSEAYTAQPANLHSSTVRAYPDGRLFHVISYGRNSMPGYAIDLKVDDRWAVVHYLRALQRSQDAYEEDLP